MEALNLKADLLPHQGDNDYLSRKEVADELNICAATVTNLVERGELPHPIGRGRNARWRRGDIRAYALRRR